MTNKEFNEAVLQVKDAYPNFILGEQFSSTVGGKVFLHQMFEGNFHNDEVPKTSDFEFFNSIGLSLSSGHFFSIEGVTDVESEFETRIRPVFMKTEREKITPDDCDRINTVLYNDKMCG
jgi:hypothetical protein